MPQDPLMEKIERLEQSDEQQNRLLVQQGRLLAEHDRDIKHHDKEIAEVKQGMGRLTTRSDQTFWVLIAGFLGVIGTLIGTNLSLVQSLFKALNGG